MSIFKFFTVADNNLFLELAVSCAETFLSGTSLPFSIYFYGQVPQSDRLNSLQKAYPDRFNLITRKLEKPLDQKISYKWSPVILERYSILDELGVGSIYVDCDVFLLRKISQEVLDKLEKRVLSSTSSFFAFLDNPIHVEKFMPGYIGMIKNYVCSGFLIKGNGSIDNRMIRQILINHYNFHKIPMVNGDQDALNAYNSRTNFISVLTDDDLVYWSPDRYFHEKSPDWATKTGKYWADPLRRMFLEPSFLESDQNKEFIFHFFGKKDPDYISYILREVGRFKATQSSS